MASPNIDPSINPNLEPPKKIPELEDKPYRKTFFKDTRDLIAYVLLVLGIILLFFLPVYGGLIIGIVSGVYFYKEIVSYLTNYKLIVAEQGPVRSMILGGIALALLISVPAIFIGAAFIILLKLFIA